MKRDVAWVNRLNREMTGNQLLVSRPAMGAVALTGALMDHICKGARSVRPLWISEPDVAARTNAITKRHKKGEPR